MNLNVYAVNYNVLRIMSGMGGLAYSNWVAQTSYVVQELYFFYFFKLQN
jgi:hypothetical protein